MVMAASGASKARATTARQAPAPEEQPEIHGFKALANLARCPVPHSRVPESAWPAPINAALSGVRRCVGLVRKLRLRGSVESFFQDVRFALRSLVNEPSFAVIAVATLALGIGANTAIFTVVNAVVLQPLPFPARDRLVRITADLPGVGASDIGVSPPELFDYRDRSGLFEEISGVYPIDANLTEVDIPERVEVLLVSPEYFSVLGVRPQLGRFFGSEDNHPGIAEVVVISDALWKRRFGGAPDAIGRKLRIDADWYTVVGVTPPEFRHPGRSLRTEVDMWAPSGYRATPFPSPPRRGAYFLRGAIGRLKPGLSVSEAQQRLDAFAAQIRQQYPVDYPARAASSVRRSSSRNARSRRYSWSGPRCCCAVSGECSTWTRDSTAGTC
jgi:hypothetical protein